MGTTSQKLSYLNDTKGKLKDSINKFRDGITDQTKFRDYATELDGIYDKLPKVDNTSDASKLLNAQNGLLDDFKMYGNTQQDSYTGQQLFNVHDNPTYDQYITLEEDYITCERTNTGTEIVSSQIYTNNLNVQPSTTYLCVCEIIEVSGTGSIKPVSRWVNQNQGQFNYDTAYAFSSLTAGQKLIYPVTTFVDLSNKTRGTRTVFEFQAGEGGRIKIRLSILTDTTITSDTFVYEPYVGGTPSPNPNYPQNINVVSGNQTINVSGKNLLKGIEEGDISDATGEDTNSTEYWRSVDYIKIPSNKTIYASLNNSMSFLTKNLRVYNKNKQYIGYLNNDTSSPFYNNATTITKVTSVADDTPAYIRFTTEKANLESASAKFMLFQATSGGLQPVIDTTYEPYIESNYTIGLGSMELCKIDTYKDSIKKSTGKNLFDKTTMVLNGVNINTTTQELASVNSSTTVYIPCKSNTTYTITKALTSRFRYGTTNLTPAVGVSVEDIVQSDTSLTKTLTTNSNAKYIVVWLYTTTYDTTPLQEILNTIQIEEGSTATNYEPYGTDWYIKKEIGKVVLDGSESWAKIDNQNVDRFQISFNTGDRTLYSNYFKGYDTYVNNIGAIMTNANKDVIALNYSVVGTTDLATFKTWLSTHNTTVYYVLITPTYEKITNETLISQLESIKVNTGSNYFTLSNSNNVLPTLYVSRLKELGKLE